jgi:hypothetical protein
MSTDEQMMYVDENVLPRQQEIMRTEAIAV